MTTTSQNHVIDQLEAFRSIPDWLSVAVDPDRVTESLTKHVPELAGSGRKIRSCTADRLRAKGAEWLARYTVSVEQPDGVREVVLIGNLYSPQVEPPMAATPDGAWFGEPGWSCWLPDLRLSLRVQAQDDALPALPTLVNPTSAAELLRLVLSEAGYRDAVITSCDPVVVRYKPGSRCTVVVAVSYLDRPSGPRPPSPVVVKTHQGEAKGEAAWAAMNALWQRPQTWRHLVHLAEPLAYLPDQRILVQGPVPEDRTLKELAREAIATRDAAMLSRLRQELAKTGRALAAIHGSGASYGRTATFEEELAEVREVLDRLSLSIPGLTLAAEPLLGLLTDRSRRQQQDPAVPAHHDFRPAQVLLHGGGVGFIDFDGACMAEPALDLGRFRAKLRDIGISVADLTGGAGGSGVDETLALVDDLCEHFLMAYQEHATVSRTRVLLWEACDLLTTMLHAWTKVRLARLEPRLTTLVHHLSTSGLLE